MRGEPEEHVLERAQLDQALGVLRELRANPVSSRQRKLFLWFQASFWGFWISLIAFFVAVMAGGLQVVDGKSRLTAPTEFLGVAMLVCFVSLFASLLWNSGLLWQTWRQFRLALRTRLWGVVEPRSTGRRWPRRLVLAATAVILAPLILLPPAWPVVLFVLPGYLFLHIARRRLDVLARAPGLEQLLIDRAQAATSAGTDAIGIPANAFRKLVDIEEAEIQRRRAEAIDAVREEEGEYALLRTRAMVSEAGRLDAATQLRVEARIENLASEPRPPEARREGDGAAWRVAVPETALEIVYEVDEEERRIDLLSIRQAGGGVATPGGTEVSDA